MHTEGLKRIWSPRLVILRDNFRAQRTDPKFGSLVSAVLGEKTQQQTSKAVALSTVPTRSNIDKLIIINNDNSPPSEFCVIDFPQFESICNGRSLGFFQKFIKFDSDLTELSWILHGHDGLAFGNETSAKRPGFATYVYGSAAICLSQRTFPSLSSRLPPWAVFDFVSVKRHHRLGRHAGMNKTSTQLQRVRS